MLLFLIAWFQKEQTDTKYTWKIDYDDCGLIEGSKCNQFWPTRAAASLASKGFFADNREKLVREVRLRKGTKIATGPHSPTVTDIHTPTRPDRSSTCP